MTDTFNLPAPPDPVKVAQWAGQLRALLAALAGAGVIGAAWAGVSAEQIANWLTLALMAGSAAAGAYASIKSWQDKRAQRALLVASAVASANTGTPVAVTITPAGMPNVATQISVSEQVRAPKVSARYYEQSQDLAP